MSNSVTVFLADDHQIVLTGIASIIELDPELKLVGSTTDSTKIVEEVMRLKPRVLVLDMVMPDIPGVEIIRTIRKTRTLQTKIVVFSMHKDIGYVVQAFQEGAQGYVVKDADTACLIKAIKAVARGEQFLSPPFTRRKIQDYLDQLRSEKDDEDTLDRLTRREREVLILVARGDTNNEISQKLGISVRTVERHRYNMMRKAGFRNEADVVQFAMRQGLIT
jgi:DNA-binding NarL/FixJ family response regulator